MGDVLSQKNAKVFFRGFWQNLFILYQRVVMLVVLTESLDKHVVWQSFFWNVLQSFMLQPAHHS